MNSKDYFNILRNDINKKARVGNKNSVLVPIIGIIFILVGVWLVNRTNDFMKTAQPTQAVLYYERDSFASEDSDNQYKVYAEYMVNGKKYYEYVTSSSSKESIGIFSFKRTKNGETATVYYNPDNPKEVRIKRGQWAEYIPIILGCLAIIASIWGFINEHFMGNQKMRNGVEIQEKILNKLEEFDKETGFVDKSSKIRTKINKLSNKISIIIGIIFGLYLCIGGIVSLNQSSQFSKNAIETTAIVSKVESYEQRNSDNERYIKTDVYVKYNVNNKNYEGKLSEISSDVKEGDNINIYYNSKKPQEIKGYKGKNPEGYIFLVFGIIIILGCIFGKIVS